MTIISIDDEESSNKVFELIMNSLNIDCNYHNFDNPFDAIEYIKENNVELVFCDVEMPLMNGIDFASHIKVINPDIRIVFTTGYDQYALNAFKVDASGYLLKPITKEAVLKEIEKAKRYTPKKDKKRIFVHTFGNFDVFVDGKIIVFNRTKAKEFLAVLIDKNGGFVSTNEMMSYLFEDEIITESLKSNYRNIRCYLQSLLSNYGIEDILITSKGGCCIDKDKIDCDYYDFLDGKGESRKKFNGEYMNNYSWGENTLAYLLNNYE